MAQAVPMIRAMAVVPAVRWLDGHGLATSRMLNAAGLSSAPFGDPMRPVSLISVGSLLRSIAEAEGPDVPCRIVSEASLIELALLGRVALGTRSPAEAIVRIAAALPLFCSHEHLSMHKETDGLVLRHSYAIGFEPETEHLMLQYAAAMVDRLCSMTGAVSPRLAHVEMPPHPASGLDHLRPWLGGAVVGGRSRAISIVIDRAVADRRFQHVARDRMLGKSPPEMVPLRGDGSFAGSARVMLASMLEDGLPSVEQLAVASGTSVRTLQRRLQDEGTSFATLLEEVRRDRAERRLIAGDDPIVSISAELGYQRQASLTRAMRRWTGLSPTRFRQNPGS